MKLLKKLLPISTITTAIAVVAPMITSCSVVASTSDFNFNPEQHSAAEMTIADASKKYFESAKYLSQDYCYSVSSYAKQQKAEVEKNYTNTSYSFGVEVKSVSLTKKTITISGVNVDGYVINATINGSRNVKYTDAKNSSNIEDSLNETLVLKNCFAFLTGYSESTTNNWYAIIGAYNEVGNWEYSVNGKEHSKVIKNNQDGTKNIDETNKNIQEHYSKKSGDTETPALVTIYSHYLEKVTIKN